MSGGRVIETLASTVVRVTTDDGIEGFGEVCPLGPAYLPAHAAGARAALQELAPAVLGLDAGNLAAVNAAMDGALMGHGYAKSAIDIACWDVLGRTVGRPVCDLLGGRVSDRFPLYFAVPLGSPEEMTAYVQARRDGGHPSLPAEDRRATRTRTPRGRAASSRDRAGGRRRRRRQRRLGLQDAVVAARAIEPLERVFFEQPCPTLEECLIVRRARRCRWCSTSASPTCTRCCAPTRRAAMEAFNLKISKVGGLTRAKLMRDLAVTLGLRVTIEDTWGGDLVTAAVSHLAASTPADDAVHRLVHERLDERARRRPPAALASAGSARRPTGRGSASRSTSTRSATRCSSPPRRRRRR